MRIRATMLSLALLLATAGGAAAETSQWFGFSAGTSVPLESFKEAATPGFALSADYTLMVNPMLGIGAEYQFHRWGTTDAFDADAEAYWGPGTTIRLNSSAYLAHATIVLPVTRVVQPFVRFSGGWYNPNSKVTTWYGQGDHTWSYTGLDVGGGFRVRVSPHTNIAAMGAWQQMVQGDDRVRFLRLSGKVEFKLPHFGEDWGIDRKVFEPPTQTNGSK